MSVPSKVIELVERFSDNLDSYKRGNYNETKLRIEYINPFFEELGWDITNKQGYAEAYKDVVHEDAIKIAGATKAPDYCFRVGGMRKFFLEAKKPSVYIKEAIHPAYQLRRYAWSAKLPLSILTDFEEFAIYDCRIKPEKNDKPSNARIKYMTFKDYPERWEEIASIFSREAILKGSFDKYSESTKRKRGTAEVDDAFLDEIESWRSLLAKNFAIRNPRLSNRQLNEIVQKTVDRIIFLRICEDRGIEDYGQLMSLQNGTNTYSRLCKIYLHADDKYNSGLFYFSFEKGRQEPDRLSLELKLDDKVLKDIFKRLYYPDSPYEFSVLPADILGQIYEQFLGKVIRLTSGHRAIVEEKPEVRKAGGVYYTPTYIVEYIVKNTVGKLLEGKTPKQAEKLKILDPACGSGSFLLGAYQYLLDWYLKQYGDNNPEKHSKGKSPKICQTQKGEWKLITAEKKRILLNNIYGVDIDSQAVEVTKLSLLLRVLESETEQSLQSQLKLFHERALPDLGNNIKCGNSLIGSDYYIGKQTTMFDEEEMYKVNAFDWEKEFADIVKTGGFDVVIGNPPYVKARDYDDDKGFYRNYLNNLKRQFTLHKMWDLYIPFVEKGVNVLNENGFFGMIVPDTIEKADYASLLRKWLIDQFYVYQIDFFPNSRIFVTQNKTVGVINTIIFVRKTSKTKPVIRFFHNADYKVIDNKDVVKHNEELFRQRSLKININKTEIIPLGDLFFTSYGLRLNSHKSDKKNKFKKADLLSETRTKINFRKFTEGKNLQRYQIKRSSWLEWDTSRCPKLLVRPTFPDLYNHKKLLLGRQTKVAALDTEKHIVDNTIIICLPYKKLKGVNNRNIQKYFSNMGKTRNELETLSNIFDIQFVLGILNSKVIKYYIRFLTQDGIDMYPDDWKKIPIPKINKIKHNKMVTLVEQMLDLNKRFASAQMQHKQTLLKRQIEATDQQIDQLVYELYGLTEKEIKIVEEG